MALTTIGSSREAVRGSVAGSLSGRRVDVGGRAFEIVLLSCLFVCLLLLGALILTIVGDGSGVYADRGWSFLDNGLSSREARAGISQGIVGSFWIAVSVVVLAFPIGIGAAIYLEEYAPKNRLTSFIELNIRNLAGVPSVVYGLLGLAIFVNTMSGFSGNTGVERRTLAAAGVTLAVLALPIVIITAAEAVRAVPGPLKEGAYGAGATKWETIRTVVLPYAAPGIFTGTLLAIARAIGEAAPLIVVGAFTLSSAGVGLDPANVVDPAHLTERFTALPSIISDWAKRPQDEFNTELAAAAIMAMLVFVLLINSLAIILRNRFEKRRSA
jgi:phosphate transport system permease protein